MRCLLRSVHSSDRQSATIRFYDSKHLARRNWSWHRWIWHSRWSIFCLRIHTCEIGCQLTTEYQCGENAFNFSDTIIICYDFPPGIQGPEHANPGIVQYVFKHVLKSTSTLTLSIASLRGKVLPDYPVRFFTGHTGGSWSFTAFKNLISEEAYVYYWSVFDDR